MNKIIFTPDELAIIQTYEESLKNNRHYDCDMFYHKKSDRQRVDDEDIHKQCETQLAQSLREKYHGRKCIIKKGEGVIHIPLNKEIIDGYPVEKVKLVNPGDNPFDTTAVFIAIVKNNNCLIGFCKHTDIELI